MIFCMYSAKCSTELGYSNSSCKPAVTGKELRSLRDQELRDSDPGFRGKGHLREQFCMCSGTFPLTMGKLVQPQIICNSKSKSQTKWKVYFVLRSTHKADAPHAPHPREVAPYIWELLNDWAPWCYHFPLFPLPSWLRVCHFNPGWPSAICPTR